MQARTQGRKRRLASASGSDYLAHNAGAEENRGSQRHHVTRPFRAPFADPAIYEDEAVLTIVEDAPAEESYKAFAY